MPSIEYDEIYNRTLTKISDINLANLKENDLKDFMCEWMQSCCANPIFRKMFSSFSTDDDMEEVTFELVSSVDSTYDINFVKNLLAKGIVVNYLPSKLERDEYLNVMVYGGDEKLKDNYKNAKARLHDLQLEFDREITTHGYYFGKYGG